MRPGRRQEERQALRLEIESIGPDGFHKLRAVARRVADMALPGEGSDQDTLLSAL